MGGKDNFNRRLIIIFLLLAILLSVLSIIIGLTAVNNSGFKQERNTRSGNSGAPYGSLGLVIEGSEDLNYEVIESGR